MVSDKSFNEVKIVTNSRLHFGFLNLKSSNSYSYGGMGLSIDKHPTILTVSKASKFESNLNKAIRDKIYHFLCDNKLSKKIRVDCIESPQKHIGLGSGTQLILSIEEAISKFYRFNQNINFFKRSYRSGVGINSYKNGGFIVDSPKNNLLTNEIIFKTNFPKEWKIILLFDSKARGLHGSSESRFFSSDTTISLRKKLSDLTLNEIIPSIIYKDFDIFARSLTKFQDLNSLFYSSIQKSNYLSHDIAKVIKKVSMNFNVAAGQSSWGPTSYMLIESKNIHNGIISILDNTISMYNNLSYEIVSAKNSGRKLSYK